MRTIFTTLLCSLIAICPRPPITTLGVTHISIHPTHTHPPLTSHFFGPTGHFVFWLYSDRNRSSSSRSIPQPQHLCSFPRQRLPTVRPTSTSPSASLQSCIIPTHLHTYTPLSSPSPRRRRRPVPADTHTRLCPLHAHPQAPHTRHAEVSSPPPS